MTTTKYRAALGLIGRGWRVLPLHEPRDGGCTCREGAECASAGKHPRVTWPASQVVDAAQVTAWWRQWPSANVGIVTGAVSGLLVLDVDPAHGGLESLGELERRHGVIPPTLTARSGGGGPHHYFAHPGVTIGPSAGKLGPGLDVRADRGLIVAPPSLHKSGTPYSWVTAGTAPAPCPPWLVEAILPPPPAPPRRPVVVKDVSRLAVAVLERAAERVRLAPDGQKHDVLWRQAFHLGTWHGAGFFGEDVAVEVLMEALGNRAKSERAAEATVRRNIAAGARHPAQVSA